MDWLDILTLGVEFSKIGLGVFNAFNAANSAGALSAIQAQLTAESAEMQAAILEMQGEYAEKVGEFNARIYDQQAEIAVDLADREVKILGYNNQIRETIAKRNFDRVQSQVVAAVGAAGIELSGSAIYVMLDNAAEADYESSVRAWATEIAQENRELQGDLEAWTAKVNASRERYIGQLTKAMKFKEANLVRDFGQRAAEIEASAA